MLYVAHPVFAFGDLCELVFLSVVEIKMCVSVAVALPEDMVLAEVRVPSESVLPMAS